ncbi:RNA binding protein, putative [Leishmania tarentolae]|uniref:RNA binding protein, putative n=1 Tax=Leishmania tarentolae TaxID=5689 RepID=A0A640KJ42_LEITA|nr:RNA binding protein, putative [Leishmania tarentolae]
MDRTATQSQSIHSNGNTNSGNVNTYGNTVSSYLSNNSTNPVMYGGGHSSNGGAPSSTSVATVYASSTQASPSQPMRQQPQGAAQQNMNQSQTGTSFNAYGGGAASGSGSGFFYSNPAPAPTGAQPMYSANPSAAAMFPMRGGSTSMTPAQPTPTQMLAPQANAAAAAAAVWTSAAANINAGSKLFVGQVPAVCTEDQLRPLFAQFGTLLEIKIMREPNGRSKGSAWVRYELEESAQRAITALNEKHIVPPQTNPLRVQFAAPSTNRMPQSLSAIGPIMPSSAVMQPQPQPNYASSATYAPPQGYAGATTAYMQGQYATSPNLMTVRASPQQQAAVQSAPGKIEYLRSNQPSGLIYSTASPTAVDAMQQQQQQQQSPQQQQVVYTAGGQMRAGVMYTPDAFAMTNQMASAPQQPHQWCS